MNNRSFYPEQLKLYEEIESWIILLIDHARFIRNGLNTTEEELFQEANQFSLQFSNLLDEDIDNLDDNIDDNLDLIRTILNRVDEFINFKRNVAREINNCQILAILPANLIDHTMREAIFFSGILDRLLNNSRPTWRELGLPDSRIALTVPQRIIPQLDGEKEDIIWEELLFWLKINYEHALVLSQYFRPQEQHSLRRKTIIWSRRIEKIYNRVLRTYERGRYNPEKFLEPSYSIIQDWTNFLRKLYQMLTTCSIPGNQMNIWPRVVDHMIREAIYFLQVIKIIQRSY